MDKQACILVTGGHGMVGSNLRTILKDRGYQNICSPTHTEVNLVEAPAVEKLFATTRPEYVFHLAARVGGIQANINDPTSFLSENILIGTNVILAAHRYNVQKLINVGSSCIYPRLCVQPMEESMLLSGPLEPTNEGYALAKLASLKLCLYIHQQYQRNYYTIIPPNLYGLHEKWDTNTSHVISALLLRFSFAVQQQDDQVVLWGTGQARREFLEAEDIARALIFCMEKIDAYQLPHGCLNVGTGHDISIAELAKLIQEITEYTGSVLWDASRPDGMPQKLMDSRAAFALGWKPSISLREGITRMYHAR